MGATFVEQFIVETFIKQEYFFQLASNIETEICEIETEISEREKKQKKRHIH